MGSVVAVCSLESTDRLAVDRPGEGGRAPVERVSVKLHLW